MDDLTKLAIKYGADKWGKHHYTPVYYDLFKDKRESVKKVIEIGTGEGAGIAMWNDFFPNAQIFGADIDPQRVTLPPIYPRITITKCDQSKTADIKKLIDLTGTDIDLVIDDGSHDVKHQLFTCVQMMKFLNKGTTYVIEDVADDELVDLLDFLDPKEVRVGKRYDDRLIVVKHK